MEGKTENRRKKRVFGPKFTDLRADWCDTSRRLANFPRSPPDGDASRGGEEKAACFCSPLAKEIHVLRESNEVFFFAVGGYFRVGSVKQCVCVLRMLLFRDLCSFCGRNHTERRFRLDYLFVSVS